MIIKGKKVILRPLKLSDAPRFVEWFSDPQFNKFMVRRKISLKEERNWIRSLSTKKKKTEIHFAIDIKEGVHVGSTSLIKRHAGDKHASFGIMIGDRTFWNRSLGSEAARLIIGYGFKKMRLHRIELDVYEYNPRAMKVYKRLGFKLEGKKREHIFWRGRFWDTYHMAILDREWEKEKT